MKLHFTALLFTFAAFPAWAGDKPEPSAPTPAAAELAALKALAAERPGFAAGESAKMSESMVRYSAHADHVAGAALKFYEAHPADPLRWEAVLVLLKTPRPFIVETKPGLDEAAAAKDNARMQSLIVRDLAARAAWLGRTDALLAELFLAPDVPVEVLNEAYAEAVYRVTLRPGAAPADKQAALRPLLAAMESHVTDTRLLVRAYELSARVFQAADPAAYDTFLQRLSQSPQPEISRWATGKANMQAAKTTALEMKFTALDGREVDLAKLRGKVVLIDFWATWCGPCKEELPNVLAAYRQYHAQGFEVVAVSLDSEKDRQKLVDYVRTHDLPWPQHFDGKVWKNEFAERLSIRAIPAMFLLDQEGKVVATDARGPKLESEIRRLLKL